MTLVTITGQKQITGTHEEHCLQGRNFQEIIGGGELNFPKSQTPHKNNQKVPISRGKKRKSENIGPPSPIPPCPPPPLLPPLPEITALICQLQVLWIDIDGCDSIRELTCESSPRSSRINLSSSRDETSRARVFIFELRVESTIVWEK